jgi:hypothetical protein
VASAAMPTRDASAIPTRFPFIGSSIETPEVAIAGPPIPRSDTTLAAPIWTPGGWRRFSDLPRLGSDLPRRARPMAEGRERAGGPKRPQTTSATLATAGAYFQVKNA